MLTGMTPLLTKLEEETARFKVKQNSAHCDIEWDCGVEIQNWPHPAENGTIHEMVGNEETSIEVYTDGNKQEQGVGSGEVIFKEIELIVKLHFKLDNRCSNNQAEQLAILKALEKLRVLNRQNINPSAWGHLNPSSYCDVGRLFYGVFKLCSKLQRKK